MRIRTGIGLALSALGLAGVALAADKPKRVEMGPLVADGIPEIPPRIGERLFQYQNSRSAIMLDWAPDGKGVLVATRFAQTNQVHFVAAPGADRQQLTFYNDAVIGARFDPTRPGAGFYFAMDSGGNEFYQHYWYDQKAGKHTLLTDGASRNVGGAPARPPVLSPSGELAYTSTRRNKTDFDLYAQAPGGEARLLKEMKGAWTALDWSPDGKQLLLMNEISANESYLWLIDASSGELRELNPQQGKKIIAYAETTLVGGTARFASNGKGVYYAADEDSEFSRLTYLEIAGGKKTVLTPDLTWNVELIAVAPDGKSLAYTVNEGGRSGLFVAPTANPKKARRVALPPSVIYTIQFDAAGKRLGFTMSAATGPSDMYSAEVKSLKVTQWTHSEVGGLDAAGFVSPTLVEYPSFDGMKIPAWVYRPRAAAAGKKLPVIVNIHGGPEQQALASFQPIFQYWVAELGVAVIDPNVRGSSGYGKTYLTLDNGFKREDSVKDIGALLDWIAQQPDLDASRVAVYGGSYGGFMVLASLVAYNDRLRCGVDVVGISHFVTFLNNTEDYRRDLRRVEYGDERDPKMKEFLNRISPLTNAKKITKPLFVIQGANDPRVPQSEAEQVVKTVRGNGGTVWYLLAKDEGHGFKKKSNRDYMTSAIALFFEENLLR